MMRLGVAALLLALTPFAGRGEDKSTTVRVTGTVILPKGAKLPQGATVTVRIYHYRPSGGNITWYSAIASQTLRPTDPSKPLEFTVAVHSSYPEKYDAGAFLMRASITAKEGDRTVTLYSSSDDDAVVPFTGNGKPKSNIRLRVSKEK